ncbi:permease of the major facilitator superfamily, partial [mine drainage metagenome]
MLYMILFFAATNALNDVEAVLVPVLARIVLHLPAWAFGALSTAFGVGALAGAWLGMRVDHQGRHRLAWVLGPMAIFGFTIVGMGFSRDGAWLAAAYAVLGLSFAVSEVVTSSLWQRMVPDEVPGTVMSTM